ncbi:hypothetical protein V5F29_00010 [Xanthobacter aminoxidans]
MQEVLEHGAVDGGLEFVQVLDVDVNIAGEMPDVARLSFQDRAAQRVCAAHVDLAPQRFFYGGNGWLDVEVDDLEAGLAGQARDFGPDEPGPARN